MSRLPVHAVCTMPVEGAGASTPFCMLIYGGGGAMVVVGVVQCRGCVVDDCWTPCKYVGATKCWCTPWSILGKGGGGVRVGC